MRLKDYQIEVLEALSSYLKFLSDSIRQHNQTLVDLERLPKPTQERVRATMPDPVDQAWNEAQRNGIAASVDPWRPMKDGAGRSVPHLCLKLPTGGGKTLLAAHGVDRVMVSYFRQITGLVLWIVPSEAIYAQTKEQLMDRSHPIRQTLDRASGGRVQILQKLDSFTRRDIQEKLCVLLLMLQSTGRSNKESLKVFQESGRYIGFFPQDDPVAIEALLQEAPNLERADLAERAFGGSEATWVKQSLGNVLRIIRPLVVLDEGHRSYSELARGTLASFNPRFLLELTATPDRAHSNILVSVSGVALRNEEMIKLPIRLEVERKLTWQSTLNRAVERLNKLDSEARSFQERSGRYIRPIMLVRVDRTGEEQREKSGKLVHSEDVFEWLTQKGGLRAESVRRQTAQIKELRDDDLLSPYCNVRAIITKDALREGWDCPFAYVLAILSIGTAGTALTQMIGRVLRQPHAARTKISMLDEAHIFCADIDVAAAVAKIKDGLESEGMGDLANDIWTTGESGQVQEVAARIRKGFRGKRLMVPRVLHKEKRDFRDLDYEGDVLSQVDFETISYRRASEFLPSDYDVGKHESHSVDIGASEEFSVTSSPLAVSESTDLRLDRPSLIRRMLEVIPNPWQAARILDEALEALRARVGERAIVKSRLTLVEDIKLDLKRQIEASAERIFRAKVARGEIIFRLLASPYDQLNFRFEEVFRTHISNGDAGAPLLNVGGAPLERALYDKVFKKDFNNFERDVALYLDDQQAVNWWWRIAVGKDWGLQGWMKNKVYPDFLIQIESDDTTARVLVLETKGRHLEGSADTEFKAKLFQLLEEAYRIGRKAGEMELLSDAPESMRFRIVLQEPAWQAELSEAIG